MDGDSRIAELERRIAALTAELDAARGARRGVTHEGEDPAVARLLADRGLLASLPDIIMVLDRQHRVLYLNRVVAPRRIEDFLGKNILEALPEEERPPRLAALERAWETGEVQTIVSRSLASYFWDNRLVPIVEDGRVTHLLTTSIDITRQKLVEEALRESESRLRHVLEATGMGTWSSSRTTGKMQWDERLCHIYGLDPATPPTELETFVSFVHPEDRARVIEQIRDSGAIGVFDDLEFRIIRADGAVRHVLSKGSVVRDAEGNVTGSYGGVFDVTERKQLEEQLRQVQKMDAIGQLTAGIAHNFNNVLGVILPNVELCLRDASASAAPRLHAIAHAGERGAELVRQLMIFARRDVATRREPIDLGESVRHTVGICRTIFDRRIGFELFVEPGLPSVLANAGQIEQVLLNVCLNARDAFEEGATEAPRIELRVDRAGSGGVRLRVRDNGPGMDESTRSRVFDPFFTTKGVDRGTGLGLASAYAIVAEHRGRISCASRLGVGTTIDIELPATDEPAPSGSERPREQAGGGSETLLLIEDEPLVRTAVRGLLELGGYRVVEAADGHEGIAAFERARPEISGVIVDRLMPGLSGEQVVARLKELDPDLPVVLLSGHPGRADRLGRASAVLAKPTSADTLLRTVRKVLDGRATAVTH